MAKKKGVKSELNWIVDLETVSPAGKNISFQAKKKECKAIAERLEIVSIESLRADLMVKPDIERHIVQVDGQLIANVTQKCILTLEDVKNNVTESIATSFTDSEDLLKDIDESDVINVEFIETEDFEPIIENQLYLGELVIQHLSLALDPYPKAPGAEFQESAGEKSKKGHHKPFSGLKNLLKPNSDA